MPFLQRKSRSSYRGSQSSTPFADKFEDHSTDEAYEEKFYEYSTDDAAADPDSDLDHIRRSHGDDVFYHHRHHVGSRPRTSSSSCPSTAYSPPKSRRRRYRLPRALNCIRIMNRTTRCLVIVIVLIFFIFILSLIRASQVDNWKLENGKIPKQPPPLPVWEQFHFLTRFYGGLGTIIPSSQNTPEWPPQEIGDESADTDGISIPDPTSPGSSKPFNEHPQSILFAQEPSLRECFLDPQGTVRIPSIRYYDGKPAGFPEPALGSHQVLNLPEDICFERFGRFGPYGLGYSLRAGGLGTGLHGDLNGSSQVWETVPRVDYRLVDWAEVQRRCYRANADSFRVIASSRPPTPYGFYIQDDSSASQAQPQTTPTADSGKNDLPSTTPAIKQSLNATSHTAAAAREARGDDGKLARTAVVVRVWDEFNWRTDDITNLRALISELSLASRGRYDVHLLVQVKNDAAHPVWADQDAYQDRVNTVPAEFRGLVTLWTETQMLSTYQGLYDLFSRGPDLPVHGSYRGLSMAMQYFGYNHPEYDFFWQWEMDARYIGHYLDFFSKLEAWGRQQPRKALWERNERFYVPAAHGSWEEFKQLAKVQSEMPGRENGGWGDGRLPAGGHPNSKSPADNTAATDSSSPLVWGPVRPPFEEDWFEAENDPKPPTQGYQSDNYKWGVGEEADLIALYPLFDPEGTTWGLKEDITGYNRDGPLPPRRAHIVVSSRVSRRLLLTMHRETALKKHFAFPEMWPATVALQHGFKAVSAPQPIYADRAWPVQYLAQTLNGGRAGASGGSRTSVFGDREHNLRGLSWFYDAPFPSRLYRRWMGLLAEDADGGRGGEDFEVLVDPSRNDLFQDSQSTSAASAKLMAMPGGEGRMCLPPMLLHPIKDIELPVEDDPDPDDTSTTEQDLDPTS